ncbi:hypothetical protein A2U01_0049768, partial [Trifolium medium]|nr:hypothetical protein [Trifolium medium]
NLDVSKSEQSPILVEEQQHTEEIEHVEQDAVPILQNTDEQILDAYQSQVLAEEQQHFKEANIESVLANKLDTPVADIALHDVDKTATAAVVISSNSECEANINPRTRTMIRQVFQKRNMCSN